MSATLTTIFLNERRSLMWSVMRIVRDREVAEDLAQETYLRACKALETRPIEHIEAFLHQTARNLALDHLRRLKTRGAVEGSAEAPQLAAVPAETVPIEAAIIEREKFRHFRAALASLPERAQTVLVLARIEGWTNARIAAHLGVSERTVFNDLKLAMAHSRDALARYERRSRP